MLCRRHPGFSPVSYTHLDVYKRQASVTGGEDPFAAYTAPVLFWCNDAAAEALDFANAIEALDLPADGRISACYLGAVVLELTGRGEVSPWFAFLNEMRRELPCLLYTSRCV